MVAEEYLVVNIWRVVWILIYESLHSQHVKILYYLPCCALLKPACMFHFAWSEFFIFITTFSLSLNYRSLYLRETYSDRLLLLVLIFGIYSLAFLFKEDLLNML